MKIGMVGLGRMGGNMTVRLLRGDHQVVAFDPDAAATARAGDAGARPAASLEELVQALEPPRAVWVMVPAGEPTEQTLDQLGVLLTSGDAVIDGGNSNWKDSIRRAERLRPRGISLIDCGTSGGIWGLEHGYCLMIGGDREAFDRLEPVFAALAPPEGYAYVGTPGAGHFVKMVHNGIEYGMLAAYGEGFEMLRSSRFSLDPATIAGIWRHGSVVRSWVLDLLAQALADDPELSSVSDYVEDSGEGRWAVQAAVEDGVPAPVTALALFARFASRQPQSYSAKVIAALRREFGGHGVTSVDATDHPATPAG